MFMKVMMNHILIHENIQQHSPILDNEETLVHFESKPQLNIYISWTMHTSLSLTK